MRRAAAVWALAALAASCSGRPSAAPEELALDRYAEADALYAAGRWAEAAPKYEEVVRQRERVLDAHVKLADCRLRTGDEAGAVDALERLLRIDRFHEDGLRALAGIRERRGEAEEAAALRARLPRGGGG